MSELLLVVPALTVLGLGALQLGLIYHGNTIVNYATFEAARTGAVNHALPAPMRRELGRRLAPLVGGDGSGLSMARGIVTSMRDIETGVTREGRAKPATELRVLNPTPEAFASWGYDSGEGGRRVIPNSHLRHAEHNTERRGVRGETPLSLRDANLLKIEVTHGLELKVPLVNALLREALSLADPANAHWYAANRLPLRSVATVRMQSEAWSDAVDAAPAVAPVWERDPVDVPAATAPDRVAGAVGGGEATSAEGAASGAGVEAGCATPSGLPSSPVLLAVDSHESGHCGIADTGYDTPGAGGAGGNVFGEDSASHC